MHIFTYNWLICLVMSWTPFYQTLNELEHHIPNIEQTWTCSSINNLTCTPYFGIWTIEHRTWNIVWPITTIFCFKGNGYRTSNLKESSLDLLNHSLNSLEHHFFRTLNRLKLVHLLVIELEHPIFGFERSNIELWT